MNKKNFLYLINILLIFMLTGCAGSFNGIKKGVLMKDDIKSNLNNSENFKETKIMSEGQVKNIFIEGLKKYYGLDYKKYIDKGKFRVNYINKQDIIESFPKFGITNYLKFLLDEEANIPKKGWYKVEFYVRDKLISSGGSINAENGDVLSLTNFPYYPSDTISRSKGINESQAKNISEKFIKDTKLANIDELEFYFSRNRGNEFLLFYKDKKSENANLYINVDTINKKVIEFYKDTEAYIRSIYLKEYLNIE
ncbi:hypothetical protein [Clostridium oceanicum]|uniref:Lipoprotein n=1 Tax=Clostridium oceanicum TaxID=1543 RepID=A0ABP3UTT9_9CLOT